MPNSVVIAGGGLAGLACAKSLVDAGCEVTVFESEPFFGGRASTFLDKDGDWIEQGIHLFLGTYSEFKKLLNEISRPPDDVLFWMTQVRMQDPEGPEAIYGANPLVAPFKTALSLLAQNDYLGPIDKLSLGTIAASSVRSMESLRQNYDHLTVKQWWQQMHGTDDVLERVLRPFCRAIQFTEAEEFSAFNFLGWLHHVAYDLPHSLLGGYRGAREDTIFKPLATYLRDKGATLRTATRIERIRYDSETHCIDSFLLSTGEVMKADAFVAAMPAWVFAELLSPELQQSPFFAGIEKLPVAPAIAVQLWFDRKVVPTEDFTLVARSRLSVYQDQSTTTYPFEGSRISATISPADDYLGMPDAEIVRLTVNALTAVRPEVGEAEVVKSVVLKHRKHLIRPLPGAMSKRPTQKTPVHNLFLAGDWTQQDYFGSQEGAVRSGRLCAAEILNR